MSKKKKPDPAPDPTDKIREIGLGKVLNLYNQWQDAEDLLLPICGNMYDLAYYLKDMCDEEEEMKIPTE